MSETVVPRTPTPPSRGSKTLGSPPPISSSELTPPPSTQVPGKQTNPPSETATLASPPSTTKPTPNGRHEPWKGPFPSSEEINRLSEPQMRDLLNEALPALGESRMALAHTKLQLNLLHIEHAEATQRAEAEHDLTRREVEVLQAGSPDMRNRVTLNPAPRSPMAQVQRHLETSINQTRELEVENFHLQRRLKQAKKVIKHLDAKNAHLTEDNRRLRDRIRMNREHFNELRPSGTSSLTPRTDASPRKTPASANPRSRNSNPLDALLMADQILSGDPASMPSTPTPHRVLKYSAGHVRGTHSLSSLPTTPLRNRMMTADELIRTPINQIMSTAQAASYSAPATQMPIESRDRSRHDRDSTISASEDEAVTDEDVPTSQASQAASSMLRRYPGPSSQESPSRGKQERLVQKKLTGKVTKSSAGPRKAASQLQDDESETRSRKKARVTSKGDVGLGIGM